eukprot:TRINITY_DN105992_c0_g1_i1.p1 TRINITY_DN105992_c0_g1~~TRINITY_DN105992_c0_g1_i1.p1  ORF type:complete len:407 (-),score=99.55 TRINITY_DN105992_c0_g1_i1:94-1281(-)
MAARRLLDDGRSNRRFLLPSMMVLLGVAVVCGVTSAFVCGSDISPQRRSRHVICRAGAKKATAQEPWKPLVFKMPQKKPPRKLEPGDDGFTMQMRERLKALKLKEDQADGIRSVSDTKVDDLIAKETEDAKINGLNCMWYLDKIADEQKQERDHPDVEVWRRRFTGVRNKLDGSEESSSSDHKIEQSGSRRGFLEMTSAMDIDAMMEEARSREHRQSPVPVEAGAEVQPDDPASEGVADYLAAIQEKSRKEDAQNKKWLSNRVAKSPEERRQDYEDTKARMLGITAALGVSGTGMAFAMYSASAAFSFGVGSVGALLYLSGLSSYTDNAESPMGSALGARRLLTPVIVVLLVTGWPKIEAQVPALAELHLEPTLLPALMGFFLYSVGKVLAGVFK